MALAAICALFAVSSLALNNVGSSYESVGGAFYDPPAPLFGAAYAGDYFFADYVAGWIYRLDVENGNVAYAFARTGGSPTNLAVGLDGAIYVTIGTRVDRIARSM